MARKPKSKVVKVSYGAFDNPHTKNVEKAVVRWTREGYMLVSRNEVRPGIFTRLLTLFLARGRTELTFVKNE